MQSIKRDLFFGLCISAFLFLTALAWGSPFVNLNSAPEAATQVQAPQPDQAKTFSGTVVKRGSSFLLRDEIGQIFKLDDAVNAQPYEGKLVVVKGQLDQEAVLIHVQSIASNEA